MVAIKTLLFKSAARREGFDDLLFEICDELQLSPSKHSLAEQRYHTIGAKLCAPGSPFAFEDPTIYPQGSMRLGTTVHPIDGPFDLDFVCQLSVPYRPANPMELLERLFSFFKANDVYKDMVERMNRCVRLNYADDFYMDILPACTDKASGETCIQVPDRTLKCWKGSDPKKYAAWFEQRSQYRMYKIAAARDAVQPLPDLEGTVEKEVLQLVVQLLKRWRDIFYSEKHFPPISVVLTTLAADVYRGEESISEALLNCLEGVVQRLDAAHVSGKRLSVMNPVHAGEDFSERWNNRDNAYREFERGMRQFAKEWRQLCEGDGNPNAAFKALFGEVVPTVIEKQARHTQSLRENQKLGIKSTGVITSASSAVSPMRPNTNHGDVP
ncbi:MAG TPA: nucleotidyltransferase [Candidatus Aquilonibacter sp.]|nr:nucleotidyltransferase [Candidatus Aquilonibacter sp.]